MGYASHLINHSKRLRNVPRLLRHEHASLVQWISNDTRLNFSKTDGMWLNLDAIWVYFCCF
uniref:Uncharacterized protein MANES_04G141800 n=1 Tax=Rhizophora mucronata TaxID=61149 RepID=A0A2P2MHW0_RHIMU